MMITKTINCCRRICCATFMVMLPVLPVQAAGEWRSLQACNNKPIAFSESTNDQCLASFCSNLPDGRKLCGCTPKNTEDITRFTLSAVAGSKAGGKPLTWEMESKPSEFELSSLVLVPLAPESVAGGRWLFGARQWTGLGLGIESWQLYVIEGSAISRPFNVADYGLMSFLVKTPDRKECVLLGGQFEEGSEPQRGNGSYFTAQWLEVVNGEWKPVPGLPKVHRRYLKAFEDQRYAAADKKPMLPLMWFRDPTTREGQQSPLKPGK